MTTAVINPVSKASLLGATAAAAAGIIAPILIEPSVEIRKTAAEAG